MYAVMDSETGGLRCREHSILSLAMMILDDNLSEVDRTEVKLKPDDGIYRVTGRAMAVNKIDLIEHDRTARRYSEVRPDLLHYIDHFKQQGSEKLIVVGHNVPFDLGFVHEHLMPEEEWLKHCSFQYIDTMRIAHFLTRCGVLKTGALSLGALCTALGIEHVDAHTCMGDVVSTAAVLRKLMAPFLQAKGTP